MCTNDQETGATHSGPTILEVVDLPVDVDKTCPLFSGDDPSPCGNDVEKVFVYDRNGSPDGPVTPRNCLACADCAPSEEWAETELVTDGGVVKDATDDLVRADPEEVDREAVLAVGDCPNCGENSLATARVEDAVYVAECGYDPCDHEIRAPVVIEDGETVVKFDLDPEEVPL